MPTPTPCLRTIFPQKSQMQKNWSDLVYWCAQVRNRDSEVFTAIARIEKAHGTGMIDQRCRKDHASGRRAQYSGRILRWLEENAETYTRTTFNQYLDSLVLL